MSDREEGVTRVMESRWQMPRSVSTRQKETVPIKERLAAP